MKNVTFSMKVNYVKVVDELLRKRHKVIMVGSASEGSETKGLNEIVKEVMRRHCKPYTDSKEDKECFCREMNDRNNEDDLYRGDNDD